MLASILVINNHTILILGIMLTASKHDTVSICLGFLEVIINLPNTIEKLTLSAIDAVLECLTAIKVIIFIDINQATQSTQQNTKPFFQLLTDSFSIAIVAVP